MSIGARAEPAGGAEKAEGGTHRMRARAVSREDRREREKGRWGCGALGEAVRWGGSERTWMAKREEGRAESVRTRRRICIGTAGIARRRFTMAAWRSIARSREARMAGVEVETGMPP